MNLTNEQTQAIASLLLCNKSTVKAFIEANLTIYEAWLVEEKAKENAPPPHRKSRKGSTLKGGE